MSDPVIKLDNFSKKFGKKYAVKNLSLCVEPGRVYGYLGRNGAGKTTTIKCMTGLIPADEGDLFLMGQNVNQLNQEIWQQVGYVSENKALYEWMSGAELIEFSKKFYKTWEDDFCKELAEKLNISKLLSNKVSQLSRGEKMKLSLLLSLSFRPKLLILDEPFSGLDPLVKEEFLDSVLEMTHQNDWSIFFSSHDLDEVEKLSDDVGIIDDGELKLNDSTDTIISKHRKVRIHRADLDKFDMNEVIGLQESGDFAEFIHTNYCDEKIDLSKLNSEPLSVDYLSLKEIFIALTKSFQ